MASEFETLWGSAQSVFDAVFGTTFSFTPMAEVKNALPIPDPDRDAIASVVGIPVIDGTEAGVGGQLPMRSVMHVRFSFPASSFPQGIQRFDRLTRLTSLSHAMDRTYEVVSAMPDPEAIYRVRVELKEAQP